TYDRAGFFRLQIDCHPTDCFLIADGKNATVLTRPGYILSEQMLHKTAEGRKTAVPRNGGVPAPRLDMFCSPMRRGLKPASSRRGACPSPTSPNEFPDEKGIETSMASSRAPSVSSSE